MFKETRYRQEAGFTIPDISLLLVTAIIIISGVLADISAGFEQGRSALKFAEVEVVLSDEFSPAEISALPRAPGSDLKVLDKPKRVKVQLPARQVKILADQGADITVLREFILVEGLGGGSRSLEGDAGILASCSGPYRYGENYNKFPIPNNGSGWAYSDIYISGAPASAIVTCVGVHYEIIHTYVGNLDVDLTDEDFLTFEYHLWENEGGSADNINETETGITAFNGKLVNQTWLLWALDVVPYSDSGYIDYWWIKVYYENIPPPNDDCADAIALTDGVPYNSNTDYATGSYESGCALNDTKDVWHSYTPTSTGLVTISLAGSTFDTTLAVFDECGGTELACNDDTCDGLQSEIMMVMTGANTYFIRVAGYYGDTGDYTLTVTNNPCDFPPEPNNPTPEDDVNNVPLDTILLWNGGSMQQAGRNETAVLSQKEMITPKIIYGEDDRLDEYEVKDADILAAGDSTVALVSQSDLIDNHDGTFSLSTMTYAEWYQLVDPIGTGNPLCSDEPFRAQPNPAWCSGFLVAPDIIATAGHCACPQDCVDMVVVFGFVMLDANTPALTIDESEIYYCSEVIARQIGSQDWAFIRLDREVTGHVPLEVRAEGLVPHDEPLLVIGHPVGLPRKYAAGASVRDNNEPAYFQANLDTYGGNSGSAVFNANTLQVEGILVRGNPDFVQDGSCDRSNECPDTGCPYWEDVTRATEFSALLPGQSYDVYFESDEPPTDLVCSDVDEPMCDPTPQPGTTLRPCTTYYWQVISKNPCIQTEGAIWSFTTTSVAPDLDKDCDVDFGDLAKLVSYWLENEPSVNIAPPDGIIDFSDFTALAEKWLWSYEP